VGADDRILLSGIDVYAYGGVTEAERGLGQRYRLDLELFLDVAGAGRTDNIEDTVSYAEVHDAAVGAMRQRPFNLIEAATERVADAILEQFPVGQVRVRLCKLLPPIDGVVESAGVEITRRR
jgi:7,8-dihydroneopterin aldolase/epimerase/oxygenase